MDDEHHHGHEPAPPTTTKLASSGKQQNQTETREKCHKICIITQIVKTKKYKVREAQSFFHSPMATPSKTL